MAPSNREAAGVDISRFVELSDGDRAGFVELVELYLSKTVEQIEELKQAHAAKSAVHVARVAHSMVGANLMVGMESLVPLLRALERAGEEGNLAEAKRHLDEVSKESERINAALRTSIS
jgi:HPt (histidine-containing phosphotransfer) domain-containing protein